MVLSHAQCWTFACELSRKFEETKSDFYQNPLVCRPLAQHQTIFKLTFFDFRSGTMFVTDQDIPWLQVVVYNVL